MIILQFLMCWEECKCIPDFLLVKTVFMCLNRRKQCFGRIAVMLDVVDARNWLLTSLI